MSQPQQQEVLTVSAFLQRVQEKRAICPPGADPYFENLKIVNDKDSGSEQQLLDLRGLNLYDVDFSCLNAEGALFRETVACRCDFTSSNWSGAQGNFQIYVSDVSIANFTGATEFEFFYSYAKQDCFPEGLTAEQTQSIIPVSENTQTLLLENWDNDLFDYIIDNEQRAAQQENRISGLEATVAALAAQVAQLTRQRQ